ncbi:MAG: hypothetical protein HQ592_00515 [Planctomycetes bacterium]|nr:hypothetical protein [Planctomycetota bacterium]
MKRSRLIGVAICMICLFAASPCLGWEGTSSYYGWFGYGYFVEDVATDCDTLLGATDMTEETSLSNDEANSYLIEQRYWWFLGHGVTTPNTTPPQLAFAGICTDKPWSTSCDLYGPAQMAGGLSVTLVHMSACNSALGVAPTMSTSLGATTWIGWTKNADAIDMATTGHNWPKDSNGYPGPPARAAQTVAQVKATQVARYNWLAATDISILGSATFVLDTDPTT